MKKAILCGYYGLGNAGDEALLLSLLQMLPPNIQPIVLRLMKPSKKPIILFGVEGV